MEVYEMIYEKVNFLLKKFELLKIEIFEDMDNDDVLDMFVDNFDKEFGIKEDSSKGSEELKFEYKENNSSLKIGMCNICIFVVYSKIFNYFKKLMMFDVFLVKNIVYFIFFVVFQKFWSLRLVR